MVRRTFPNFERMRCYHHARLLVVGGGLLLLLSGYRVISAGHTTQLPTQHDIELGYAWQARLSDFLPVNMRQSCLLLEDGDTTNPSAAFEARLKANPDDLAAYVGYVQCNRSIWPTEIKRLRAIPEDELPVHDNDFRLGLLLYYREAWADRLTTGNADMRRAKILLRDAWRRQIRSYQVWDKCNSPVIGFVWYDIAKYSPYDIPFDNDVLEKLIRFESGGTAYQQYLNAQRNHWKVALPAIGMIPADRLRPLREIVYQMWRNASARYGPVVVLSTKHQVIDLTNPKLIQPQTPSQIAKARYLRDWYHQLGIATGQPD